MYKESGGTTVQMAGSQVQHTVAPQAAARPNDGDLSDDVMRLLARYHSETLVHWVWLLEQHQTAQPWPRLRLSDVRAEPPALLDAVAGALRSGSARAFLAENPAAAIRLRRQLSLRLIQGTPLTAVLNEQALLRDELWALFARHLTARCRPSDLLALARALDGTLQCVLELAILAAAELPPREEQQNRGGG